MQGSTDILIVEDDEGIREGLRLALELEGYGVVAASNGKEGLEELSRMPPPCLILLDLMMPVMDGWTFAERLRSNTQLAAIPVVAVTAFAEMAGSVTQARGVLKKPVDLDGLLRMVHQFCA